MPPKTLPFTNEQLERILEEHPTPFHIYDEAGIRESARALNKAFDWDIGYKNYFAVKALPNPQVLRILREEGMGADCSSLPELMLAETVGMRGEEIMFTSNGTPASEYEHAKNLHAIINLDDISHINFFERNVGELPPLLSFRYNPGSAREGNVIIGKPEEAKYGLTTGQITEAYKIVKEKGVKHFGLHTMVISNELREDYFIETARMLFSLAAEISEEAGIDFEFINLGGGLGIPYRPEQDALNLEKISWGVKNAKAEFLEPAGLEPKIVTECGRFVTGPHGYLVTKVLHVEHKYRDYVKVDATMANLMRPALYGAYHHITVLGKEDMPEINVYDVTGSLCENNDKFAIQRPLPLIEPGDTLIIHDTGAHGHAMGFNYNGKLRSAELLLREDCSVKQIRRQERNSKGLLCNT
ncbi:diaminopimelate decarboxylase [Candidatus Pacearchaeota archaeon]|nr:diaminopimelate decarboxylase [Candidatus Pacearchaeota archaeon]